MKDNVGNFLLDKRINAVLPHVKGKLLDMCCGSNQLVKKYPGDGLGIDIEQWGNVDVIFEDASKLTFNDKTFDTITILASLNYIPNKLEALKETNRILKDSGRLIITMIPPKISQIWHLFRDKWDSDHSELLMKNGQTYGLTENKVSELLTTAGYEVELNKKFMFRVNNLTIAKKSK